MKVALDTNCYSAFAAGDARVIDIVRNSSGIVLPFIVLAELRAGFAYGSRTAENEKKLAEFLSSPWVSAIFADDITIRFYASLFKFTKTIGKTIPSNDLWIAAIVEQHALTLCTHDTHFDVLPQIPRI